MRYGSASPRLIYFPARTVRTRRGMMRLRAFTMGLACIALAVSAAQAQGLKKYDSTTKEFWEKPPADWFLGDETEQQKGLAPPAGPALPTSMEDLQKNLAKVKLPKGFKIEVYAQGVPSAR